MLLQELAPEIAQTVDYMDNVIIIGPTICSRCDQTGKLFKTKGIAYIKVIVENREHALIVALKKHLGVEPDDFVNMPMVFVNGEFRWHDMNMFEISNLAKSYELVA